MVKNNDLLERLRILGFPFFEMEEKVDPNAVLSDLVKSGDTRMWEIFPAVLTDSLEKGLFDQNRVSEILQDEKHKKIFGLLVAMSLALFKRLGLRSSWEVFLSPVSGEDIKQKKEEFFYVMDNEGDLSIEGHKMSTSRLRNVFKMYLSKTEASLNDFITKKEELGIEYSLAQLLSPRQKDIFLKKFRGEKLSKTEKEYYSRVIKKKVVAMANTDLQRMAIKLLGL
jgi:hypothetical protein